MDINLEELKEAAQKVSGDSEWLRSNQTIYALTQDGWRKGEPAYRNRMMIQVQQVHEQTPEEVQNLATYLVRAQPMVVLELIERLEKKERELREVQEFAMKHIPSI